jgi:hypothetical protein
MWWMFRLGRFVVNDIGTTRKPRPILVKLRVASDKRIILGKRSKLEQYTQRGVFITPDMAVFSLQNGNLRNADG